MRMLVGTEKVRAICFTPQHVFPSPSNCIWEEDKIEDSENGKLTEKRVQVLIQSLVSE